MIIEDPVEAANTLLHEILHACWYTAQIQDEDKEERTITAFANQLTQVWRDNPAVIAWIGGALGVENG